MDKDTHVIQLLFESASSVVTVCPPSAPTADATRRRAFALVSQAYTSIVADDFAAFVGLPVEEAVKGTCACLSLSRKGPGGGVGVQSRVGLLVLRKVTRITRGQHCSRDSSSRLPPLAQKWPLSKHSVNIHTVGRGQRHSTFHNRVN